MATDPDGATDRLATAERILAQLIAEPTVFDNPARPAIDLLATHFQAIGARVWIQPDASGDKANLVAVVGPDAPGGLVLSGHVDVASVDGQSWSADPFRARRVGDRIYGRGACDMKGFVACVAASADLFAGGARPMIATVTFDEEVGCLGAQALLPEWRDHVPPPALCLVGEPSRMGVIDAHKGCFEYRTRFVGRAGHASAPELGASAVEAAARFVAAVFDLDAEMAGRAPPNSPYDPPRTTLQAGVISGGSGRNVIAETALVDWEMRPVCAADADFGKARIEAEIAERLLPRLRAGAPEARIETDVVGEVAGLERRADCPAAAFAERISGVSGRRSAPFGTEAGLFQADGVPTVICGPGDIAQAHQPDEFIEVDELAACLTALERAAMALRAP